MAIKQKYVGDADLASLALDVAKTLRQSGMPIFITGSIARKIAKDEKPRAHDVDMYVDGTYEAWADKIRKFAEENGFKETENYRKLCEGWQNILQFVKSDGNGNNLKSDETKDVCIDFFFNPILFNDYLREKVNNGGVYIVKIEEEKKFVYRWDSEKIW